MTSELSGPTSGLTLVCCEFTMGLAGDEPQLAHYGIGPSRWTPSKAIFSSHFHGIYLTFYAAINR